MVQSNSITITVSSVSQDTPYLGPLVTTVTGYTVNVSWPNFSAVQPGINPNGIYITGESVDWGDGSAVQSIPAGDTGATYTYNTYGKYTITVTLGNSQGMFTQESTSVTIKQQPLPTWSWSGEPGQSQTPSAYGLELAGFMPFPAGPDFIFYQPGDTGFMVENISSTGNYLTYTIVYGLSYGGSYYDVWGGSGAAFWVPVFMADTAQVNAALAQNANVVAQVEANAFAPNEPPFTGPYATSEGQAAMEHSFNQWQGLASTLNQWIVNHAIAANPLQALQLVNPLG